MPRKEINYENTYFYKIVCRDMSICDAYIGHTTEFTKRKCSHKSRCNKPENKEYNKPLYVFIRDHGGWDNFEMVLIDACKCNDRLDALRKERELKEQLCATLNKQVPGRTKDEYTEHYKPIMREKRDQNPEFFKNRSKEQYQKHRDRYREYYESHKAEQLEKDRSNTIQCECGDIVQKRSYNKHIKGKWHAFALDDNFKTDFNNLRQHTLWKLNDRGVKCRPATLTRYKIVFDADLKRFV